MGAKEAGSITAALFLEEFLDQTKPFAHIDLAGPVWTDDMGATGWGTKLISEWICQAGMDANAASIDDSAAEECVARQERSK